MDLFPPPPYSRDQIAAIALGWLGGFALAAVADTIRHRYLPQDEVCMCRRCDLLAAWREQVQIRRQQNRLAVRSSA